jgi:hypothetical protein
VNGADLEIAGNMPRLGAAHLTATTRPAGEAVEGGLGNLEYSIQWRVA